MTFYWQYATCTTSICNTRDMYTLTKAIPGRHTLKICKYRKGFDESFQIPKRAVPEIFAKGGMMMRGNNLVNEKLVNEGIIFSYMKVCVREQNESVREVKPRHKS